VVAAGAEVAAGAAASVVAAVAGLLAAEVAAAAAVVAAAGSVAAGSWAAWVAWLVRAARAAAYPGERAACAKSHDLTAGLTKDFANESWWQSARCSQLITPRVFDH
jgi:hypothetical protein